MPGNEKPTLMRVGYFTDDVNGPRLLIEGRDPNGDIKSYTLKLLKDGQPAPIDPDGDGVLPESDTFTAMASGVPGEAGFVFRFDPTTVFTSKVDQVIVTVTDAMNNTSDPMMSGKYGVTPTAAGMCDPNGFNKCSGTNVCALMGASYRCASAASARTVACNTAPLLDLKAGTTVNGTISAPSRWDAPTGCTNAEANQPDGVFKLRLAAPATVVLKASASTQFDSVLYLLGQTTTACAAVPAPCAGEAACLCADDDGTGSAEGLRDALLRLPNLAAGDYLIAIDSSSVNQSTGNKYEVTATVE